MTEIINLRLARKARDRAQAAAKAATNRARHGETKVQKAARKAEAERATRVLDNAHREDPS